MSVASREYFETQVLTATPYRLHQLVIDGAIRFARNGQDAMRAGDWETMFLMLNRSRDCVTELVSGLRDDVSEEIVARAKSLFAFVYQNLALADFERDPARIDDAVRILELHRETWLELGTHLAAPAARPAARHDADDYSGATHRVSWDT